MTERRELPTRRPTWRQKAVIGGQTFYADFGEYEDGTLGEVFLDASKQGTFLRGILGALARMISLALQYGTPVEVVVKGLRGLQFPPDGPVIGEGSAVTEASSLVDWIAREIENVYIKKES